jgi:hypothetical protein
MQWGEVTMTEERAQLMAEAKEFSSRLRREADEIDRFVATMDEAEGAP